MGNVTGADTEKKEKQRSEREAGRPLQIVQAQLVAGFFGLPGGVSFLGSRTSMLAYAMGIEGV